jgi:arabinofuranan 3-O-arabinosyltransferase
MVKRRYAESNTVHVLSAVRAERRLQLLWALFACCALVIYLPALITWVRIRVVTGSGWLFVDRDFVNYWVGAQLARAGDPATLFSYAGYYAHLQSLFGAEYPIHSWSYPPHYLFFIWPLASMSFETALVCFEAVTFAAFVWAAVLFRRRHAPDASLGWTAVAILGFTFMMLATTQNGFLTAAAALLALTFMHDRPVAAGLALACLTIKPQVGILFPCCSP